MLSIALAPLGGTMLLQAGQPNTPLSQHWNSRQLACRQSSCLAGTVETLQLSCRVRISALHVHNGLTADRRPKQLHYRSVHPAMCCNARPLQPRSASWSLTMRRKATKVDYAVGNARLRCNARTSRSQQRIQFSIAESVTPSSAVLSGDFAVPCDGQMSCFVTNPNEGTSRSFLHPPGRCTEGHPT